MIVNKHDKTRRGECLSETLKAVFLDPCKAVGHGDSRANPIPFGQEQPGAEFNSPFRGNLHINLHFDHPAKTTLPNGRSSVRWRKASPASAKG